MKTFIIESRRGFVSLPCKIASYNFPISFGSRQAATPFLCRSMAEKSIKKYNLAQSPHFAHIEGFEEN